MKDGRHVEACNPPPRVCNCSSRPTRTVGPDDTIDPGISVLPLDPDNLPRRPCRVKSALYVLAFWRMDERQGVHPSVKGPCSVLN